MAPGGYTRVKDLPERLAVFPVDGAILFPRSQLPLNVFEPRYLNMVDDAMAGNRLIGMIQTRDGVGGEAVPPLAAVGCVGRVTAFAETSDGRYLITLTGVCRFHAGRELELRGPYRSVAPDFSPFAADFEAPADARADRQSLLGALRPYLDARGLGVDWEKAQSAPLEGLANSLCMALPFDVQEKQMLLEAPSLDDRLVALKALLAIDAAGGPSDDDDPPLMH